MKTLILRNKIHHTIGYLDIDPTGLHVISDKHHRKLGTYCPRDNRLRDRLGATKGYGFLLALLLGDDALKEHNNEEIEESGPVPSKPTSAEARAKIHAKRNDLQKKVNDERAKSAEKIASIQAKRP